MKNIHRSLSTGRVLFSVWGGLLLFSLVITAGSVSAQTPEDICPNPGTSAYVSCIASLEDAFERCSSTFGTGNQAWQSCRQEAIDQFLAPSSSTTTTPQGPVDGVEVLETDCSENRIDADNCQIVRYLVTGINFLSALAGLAIVASIMYAGYQYMTARDNSGQIEAAKKRIIWAIVALVLFVFMYAILNFLVPGGVL